MNVLDCSVVHFSQLVSDGANRRIDSEFFSKRFIENERILETSLHAKKSLRDITTKIDVGYVSSMVHEYVDSGIPLLQTQNIHQFLVDYSDCNHISPEFHASLYKSQVFPGDCLVARSGSIGNTAFVLENDPQPLNSADIIIVRANDRKVTNSYLAAFLNSKIGGLQVERYTSGGVQGHINLKSIEYVVVPLTSRDLQVAIDSMVRNGMSLYHEASEMFGSAEQLLMKALGLEGWQPPEPLTYTCRSSVAFAAGRLDAEYFSPPVIDLVSYLRKDGLNISNVASSRKEHFDSHVRGDFNYIEISDVHIDGNAASERMSNADAPSRATWHVHKGDVITSMVRPIRCLSAQITQDQDGFVCSSGFVVLKPVSVSSELLLTYLRLPLVCELMDLHTSASMYPAISEEDLLNIPFRQIDSNYEDDIIQCIREAHRAHSEARLLLEQAKHAVEIAIEQSEAAALDYLKEFDAEKSKSN